MSRRFLSKCRRKLQNTLDKRAKLTLKPTGKTRGRVLLSYLVSAFSRRMSQSQFDSHTSYWECRQIAQTYVDLGYCVDIINWDNQSFKPRRNYVAVIDIHSNLERWASDLNEDCIKILHVTGAHWLFQNHAEYSRLLALQQRRRVTLRPRRIAAPSLGIEHADCATVLGNQFTISTFSYAGKPIHRIPISTTHLFPWQEAKNYEACRQCFLWLGSSGMVHKGLDLLLEAFAQMPEHRLIICGPVADEEDFVEAFHKELYETANIETIGWIDVASHLFRDIIERCAAVIYPSSSEGGGGSVITALHAGLIPIVSRESSIDVDDFGFYLTDCSVDEIRRLARHVSDLHPQEIKARSRKAWQFAREQHTREKFAEEYRDFAIRVLGLSVV